MKRYTRFYSSCLTAALACSVFLLPRAAADFVLFDDFEAYPVGDINQDPSSPWTPHNTGLFTIFEGEENQYLGFGWSNGPRAGSRTLPPQMEVASGGQATLFLQFRAGSFTPGSHESAHFGLGHNISSTHSPSADMRVEVALRPGPSSDEHLLQVRDGEAWRTLTTVTRGLWYNLWLMIDRTAGDEFEVYLNQHGEATAVDRLGYTANGGSVTSFAFGGSGGANEVLNGFAGFAHISTRSMNLDNIWIDNTGPNLSLQGRDFNSWQTVFQPVSAPLAIDFGTGTGESDGSFLVRERSGDFTLEPNGLRYRSFNNSFTTSAAMAVVDNYQGRQNFTITAEMTLQQLFNVSAARVGLAILAPEHVPFVDPFNHEADGRFYTLLWYPALDGENSQIQIRRGFNGPILAQQRWEGLHPSIENAGQGGIGSRYIFSGQGVYDNGGVLDLTFSLTDANGYSQDLSVLILQPVEGNLFGFGGRLSNVAASNQIDPEFTFHRFTLNVGDVADNSDPVVQWPFEFGFGADQGGDVADSFRLNPEEEWSLESEGLVTTAQASNYARSFATSRVLNYDVGDSFGLRLRFSIDELAQQSSDNRFGVVLFGASDLGDFEAGEDGGHYMLQFTPGSSAGRTLVLRRGANGPIVAQMNLNEANNAPVTGPGDLLDLSFSAFYKEDGNLFFLARLEDQSGGEAELRGQITQPELGPRFGFGAWHRDQEGAAWRVDTFAMGAPSTRGAVETPFTDTDRVVGLAEQSFRLGYTVNGGDGFIGSGGTGGDRRHSNPVLGFELPDVSRDSIVYFELNLSRGPRHDGPSHLYGLAIDNPATFNDGTITPGEDGVDLWYQGSELDNRSSLIGAAWANAIPLVSAAGERYTIDVTDFIRSFYDEEGRTQEKAFFRLSPAVTLGLTNLHRSTITHGKGVEGSPALQYIVFTELEVQPPLEGTFAAWQEQYFSPAQLADDTVSGPAAAPAGDNVSNLIKYAFDLAPLTPFTQRDLFGSDLVGGDLVLVYYERTDVDDLAYTVEFSQDLVTWPEGGAFLEELGRAPAGSNLEQVTVRATLPAEAAKGFLRLKVELH